MESRNISSNNLEIVFEKANIDYNKMKNLLRACQANPKHENTRWLKNIDIDNISAKKKREESLLQVADLVAHTLYKCVDKQDANYNIPEPRYVSELSPRFFGHPETNLITDAGIYCVHSTADLNLDQDVETKLKNLIAMPAH